MFDRKTFRPATLYFIILIVSTFCYGLVFTVNTLYFVTVVKLSPLELVLIGTALELSIFLFEVPTGVVADVFSRRLSVIIGYVLIGLSFVLQGLVPSFAAILFANALWGFGYTFTSGALTAWLVDEIGEDSSAVLLRGARLEQWAGFVVAPVSIALAFGALIIPLTLGGIGFVLLAVFLIAFMPEHGFKPAPREDRNSWAQMQHTLLEGWRVVRAGRSLVIILAISVIFGAASESFDRLWLAHLLSFELPKLPTLASLEPDKLQLVWVGLLELIGTLIALPLLAFTHKRLETSGFSRIVTVLFWTNAALIACVLVFALAPSFALTLLGYLGARAARTVIGPLSNIWLNTQLESNTRATVLSMNGQADAVGQIAGGPIVGWLGNSSLRLALAVGAGLLSPALGLYARSLRTDSDD
jgi:MFS transporter, DHA3 family, tetracycline resistance protein